WRIERLVAAIAHDRARIVEEAVSMLDPFDRFSRRFGGCVIVRWQFLDLIRGEHRIRFEEGNAALDLLAIGVGLGFAEAASIDDGCSTLPLADMTAEFECLLEGHPIRRGKAVRDTLRPKKQCVDALI